jgi:hypothetical protein
MAVIEEHVPILEEILRLPGALSSPLLLFGLQEIGIAPARLAASGLIPKGYDAPDLATLLCRRGVEEVDVLDWFDERANIRHDMNTPLPPALQGRYRVLIDIGSLEHVFDTRQCLENCMKALVSGGIYVLHTCVKGYFRHGLHTFHPGILLDALKSNGFEILWCRYTSWDGALCLDLRQEEDVLLWVVARKGSVQERFVSPQQVAWAEEYGGEAPPKRRRFAGLRKALFPWIPPVVMVAYRAIRGRRVRSLVAQGLRGDGD